MGENLAEPDRMAVRTPMQWSDEPGGGFSTADPSDFPTRSAGGEYGPLAVNVAAQRRDPGSLLNWFERLIRRRKETHELGFGEWQIIETEPRSVLAHRFDWDGTTVIVLHNFSPEPVPLRVPIERIDDAEALDDLFDGGREPLKDMAIELTLPGHGHRWFRVHRAGQRITP